MRAQITLIWNKISRIGLNKDEGVHTNRQVIFLNRMLALLPVILAFYIPVEIFFNGAATIHVIVIMALLFLVPLPLHHFRLFRLAHYYIFLIGNLAITYAGILVGKGVNNHVTLIPIVLIAIILFQTKIERIIALLVSIAFFAAQNYFLDVIPPTTIINPENKSIFSFVFFILAMVMSFLVGFYFIGINSEYEAIVNMQKEALAHKNEEITASITYAKRIQNAILPPHRLVKKYLPDSFILYKPKDIVAGDFYWMEKVDKHILFSAADSTGHGVPGAMVSVICNNALSRSVREFKLTQPSLILDKAREIVISEFEKSDDDVKDGMDISLCALNSITNELQWSGANNPLIIIRNNEIIEIKPDKQPVGKYSGAKNFTNHLIQLQKGDLLYIFSDGYSDQFGGENGKKLKYKTFKQLLLKHHTKTMAIQKTELNTAIELWKGGLEQVDDICIIGLRI